MLLVHQAGGLQVGQTARYTLTYTPSADRILPSPTHLYLKIKNHSPLPLRAAYLHGPYSLYVSAYPSTFNPNQKANDPSKHGVPEFEPYLKAGANWTCKLIVPEDIRESGDDFAMSPTRAEPSKQKKSVTWIVEIVSQVIFSNSATVQFELLVGRDERSLELGFASVAGHGHGGPGQLAEHKKTPKRREGRSDIKGVYSRAIKLKIEDTEDLWNKPRLPETPRRKVPVDSSADPSAQQEKPSKKQKVHLVVLTHGLHSNLSADLLYMKESIDATVAQAREERRARRAKSDRSQTGNIDQEKAAAGGRHTTSKTEEPAATAPLSGGQEHIEDDEDEEQVIVRGFSGNAVRTERGIQYLGKRLAKYVLHLTYPSQPFLPVKRTMSQSITSKFGMTDKKSADNLPAPHPGSTIHHNAGKENDQAYQFTSVSFVGHSLGGLTQLYAIAYIQKHAPEFFTIIQPINFICMASPLLGLSNENPMYVKFALDFGLVGRTGQDLGLTWRAPTLAKSGWSAIGGVFGAESRDSKEQDPGAKPLLRILPTGPAHRVLHQFRNRTLYSNVVNDGIVPLRTSCLLFLDWKGLGKVQKYRREGGVLGTMAEWGWNELTGANAERNISLSPADGTQDFGQAEDDSPTTAEPDPTETVPQPSESTTTDDNKNAAGFGAAASHLIPSLSTTLGTNDKPEAGSENTPLSSGSTTSVFDGFLNLFRPNNASNNTKSPTAAKRPPKAIRALQRGQTLNKEQEEALSASPTSSRPSTLSRGTTDNPSMRPDNDSSRPSVTRGDTQEQVDDELAPPPKTSIFESASDLLHPPVPSTQWIIEPTSRPRTIFHDRVYHPSDIPPPPARRPSRSARSFSTDQTGTQSQGSSPILKRMESQQSLGSEVGMKVEEKIARAYHRDLSWRKVLVKLEPDAHNNMVVRRMFANAYGWPVVKHLCDTHFGDTWAAQTRDEDESGTDRAATDVPIQEEGSGRPSIRPGIKKDQGEEVKGQTDKVPPPVRRDSELREVRDELTSLQKSSAQASQLDSGHHSGHPRKDTESSAWDEDIFSASESDDDDENIYRAGPTGSATPPPRKQSLGSKVMRGSDGRLRVRTMQSFSSSPSLHGNASKQRRPSARSPDVVLKADPFDGTITAEPEPMDWKEDAQPRSPSAGDAPTSTPKGLGVSISSPADAGLKEGVNDAMNGSISASAQERPGEGRGPGVAEKVADAAAAVSRNQY